MMKKIRIRTSAFITALLMLVSMLSIAVSAAEYIDPDKSSSLELNYQYEEKGLSDIAVKIYRIASVSSIGEYTLAGAFAEYPIRLDNVTDNGHWKEIASTFAAYAAADAIAPTITASSDKSGKILASELETGMYLVVSENKETAECTYLFDPFLISVPNLDENDNWVYDVTANPKAEAKYPTHAEISHKVIKLWEDTGWEKERPESITVEILKNGEKVSEQILSADNNWAYSWMAPDDGSVWHAVERGIPDYYTVSVKEDSTTIAITNTCTKTPKPHQPSDSPQTGDTGHIEIYFILMIVSGTALIILGVKRHKQYAKQQ